MISTEPPSFASYLVSSFSFPRSSFRNNRHSSTPSVSSSFSTTSTAIFSSAGSIFSSTTTTPSTSPPNSAYLAQQEAPSLDDADDDDTTPAYKLHRAKSDYLKCSTCATDLAFTSQIISKAFTGRHGRAYLVTPPTSNSSTYKAAAGDTQEQRGNNLINVNVGMPVNRQLATGAHVVADISCAICTTVIGWKYVDAKDDGQKYKIGKFILETKRVAVMRGWEDVSLACGRGDVDESGFDGDDDDDDDITFNSDDEDECDEIFAGTWDRRVVQKRRAKKGRLWLE